MPDHAGLGSRLAARRGWLAAVALGVALVTTVGYWLGATGAASTSIFPLPGTTSTGGVADVVPMSSTVTRSNGEARLTTGVALAKLVVAAAATAELRVDVAWTNVLAAARVLGSPNAQLSLGLYHPVHTGACVSVPQGHAVVRPAGVRQAAAGGPGARSVVRPADVSEPADAPLVSLTDTDGTTLCAALDESATGSGSVSDTGKLLLARDLVAGYLVPGLDGGAPVPACAPASTDTGGWCQPASLASPAQRALYLVASVTTPGDQPKGQQRDLSSLTFFVSVRRLG